MAENQIVSTEELFGKKKDILSTEEIFGKDTFSTEDIFAKPAIAKPEKLTFIQKAVERIKKLRPRKERVPPIEKPLLGAPTIPTEAPELAWTRPVLPKPEGLRVKPIKDTRPLAVKLFTATTPEKYAEFEEELKERKTYKFMTQMQSVLAFPVAMTFASPMTVKVLGAMAKDIPTFGQWAIKNQKILAPMLRAAVEGGIAGAVTKRPGETLPRSVAEGIVWSSTFEVVRGIVPPAIKMLMNKKYGAVVKRRVAEVAGRALAPVKPTVAPGLPALPPGVPKPPVTPTVLPPVPAEVLTTEELGIPIVAKPTPVVPPVKPPEPEIIPAVEPEVPTTDVKQIGRAHMIARKKLLITPEGKTRPQYRRLAYSMTGKKSTKDMTEREVNIFIDALEGLPEPRYKAGQLIPPSIAKTQKIVPEGFYKREFKEPTIARYLTPQTYYSQILGVKEIVEPLEIAKQEFDLNVRSFSNEIAKKVIEIDKIGGTTFKEKARAKIRNVPTKAVAEMRDLLDKYENVEDLPATISDDKRSSFRWFRNLTKSILKGENELRAKMDMPLIPSRKAYVRHVADAMAEEMLAGRYPFPEGTKYWSEEMVGKKVYNPMEFRRTLVEDLENLWTRDLGHAMKSMVWTGLKEIHLTQPLKFFNEQLNAFSKDKPIYKDLKGREKLVYEQTSVIPASTKRWMIDYVNQVIKGQETSLDASVNRIVTQTGLKGLFNKILAPYGRTVGRKPLTNFFQMSGRLLIHGVLGPLRPKQLIRNKFQLTQNLALYGVKANIKGFFPATKKMKELMDRSLFLKTYTGLEELPTGLMSQLEKYNLAAFQWSAVSNVSQTMKVAYWDTTELISNPKYKDFGWADPQRTYTEPKEFLYPSERELMLREMEFGASASQYHYIPMSMPEVFRHKTLIPATRLQSWWMNYFAKFTRESITRGFKGTSGYSSEYNRKWGREPKLPWSRRIGYLRYLILGGAILNTLGYTRSYVLGAAPTGLPPAAQLALAMYVYATTQESWKRERATRQMFYAFKTFIPGYLSYQDFKYVLTGEKSLDALFFYTKRDDKARPTRRVSERTSR